MINEIMYPLTEFLIVDYIDVNFYLKSCIVLTMLIII